MADSSVFKSGYVAIVGRPNVGKSTLMNRLLGQKISITSDKPQTTRHRILGIKSEEAYQVIYVDTPGLHLNAKKAMNRYMNKAVSAGLEGVDLVVCVVDVRRWTKEDDNLLRRLADQSRPVILVVNMVDTLKDKGSLLEQLAELQKKGDFTDIVPLSALKGDNVEALERLVVSHLPTMPAQFDEEMITDRSERFLAAEMVREKLMRRLGKELPYALTVEIESFEEDGERQLLHINALIWVERSSQKRIVIGKGGVQLREVGRLARIDMEGLFGKKVFLQLWVKVKDGWSDNERILSSLGYE